MRSIFFTLSYFRFLLTVFIFVFPVKSYGITILCLGDSLTEGFGVAKEDAWPALVEKSLNDSKPKENYTFINAGISGATTASGPGRLNWHIKSKQKFDWVFIELGANDGLRGQDVEAMKQNLLKTIKIAKDHKVAKIFLADMKVPTNYGAFYAKKFESAFAQVAKDQKIDLVPFLLEGVAGKSQLNLPDGIHPNKEGHVIVAKNLEKYFRSVTAKK